MPEPLSIALALAYGYLIGSVPIAYVVGRAVRGVDLRRVGSGTVGASNVYYNVGRYWIVPVGVFDLFVKGLTPVHLAALLGLEVGVQAAAALLAVAGHNWPVFLGFKGGRGVAPTVGVLVAIGRLELAAFIVLTAAGWRFTGAAGVWVLLGFVSLPLLALHFDRPVGVVLLMVGLLLITIVKRMASNSPRGSGVALPRLLFNRLVFDRDVVDHDAWMRRNTAAAGGE